MSSPSARAAPTNGTCKPRPSPDFRTESHRDAKRAGAAFFIRPLPLLLKNFCRKIHLERPDFQKIFVCLPIPGLKPGLRASAYKFFNKSLDCITVLPRLENRPKVTFPPNCQQAYRLIHICFGPVKNGIFPQKDGVAVLHSADNHIKIG